MYETSFVTRDGIDITKPKWRLDPSSTRLGQIPTLFLALLTLSLRPCNQMAYSQFNWHGKFSHKLLPMSSGTNLFRELQLLHRMPLFHGYLFRVALERWIASISL
ncbi:hypothetical protein Nepgr_023750 [Nepenthes gracilis]|uniref:Uncharacterized protein n=1 Tax=Nepenthes gracilis TaxID=150966 RepID=A0AAD3T343_NEPGR|nr:hypothetical protein Nepgr_023750 [Nepenthes gracilis]